MSKYLEFKEKYPKNWKEISKEIKDRAGWKCERCGRLNDWFEGYTLTVHHLDGDPLNCNPKNLIALCQRCHLSVQSRFHPKQEWLPWGKPDWVKERGY